MLPALRISCFISNGSAQPGKLIKGCSQVCTERAALHREADAAASCRLAEEVLSSFTPMPGAAMLLCLPQGDGNRSLPRWHVPWWALCHRGRVTGARALCKCHARGAGPSPERHMVCFTCPCGQLWPTAMLMQFPQFQDNKEKFSPSYGHFRQIGSN